VTDDDGVAPGWYADPLRRYDHRWFNGRSWTADVSAGGARSVDPHGIAPVFTPGRPSGAAAWPQREKNGPAIASMVLGIVAISIAWIPVFVVFGLIAAVVGLAFVIPGLRRARRTGVGRGFALAGLATAGSALVLSVFGFWLTAMVLDAYDRFLNPAPHAVEVTGCELRGARAMMSGELENTGATTASYTVEVSFVRPGTDNARRTERVALDDVAAGDRVEFEASTQVDLDEIDCLVAEVTGPLPFGIEVD
jgi:hypothetical protein